MTNHEDVIQRRLLQFRADTDAPRWSSHALDELLVAATAAGGTVGDVIHALYSMMSESRLTSEVASFIMDMARCAFVTHKESYAKSSFTWMDHALKKHCSAAQAYLALYTMPPRAISPRAVVTILQSLAGSPYWREAVVNLEDELDGEDVRALLSQWLSDGVDAHCRAEVERLAEGRS